MTHIQLLKNDTDKCLAETLLCFSLDLIKIMGEYANELRLTKSIPLNPPLTIHCQTAVILNENGDALFHCGKSLEFSDEKLGRIKWPYHLTVKNIAFHRHSDALFLFATSSRTACIFKYKSIYQSEEPSLIQHWTGKSAENRQEMGIYVDNLFPQQDWRLHTANSVYLQSFHKSDATFSGGYNEIMKISGLDCARVKHLVKTKEGHTILCTTQGTIKVSKTSRCSVLTFNVGYTVLNRTTDLCVAIDEKDHVYVLVENTHWKEKHIFQFDQDGTRLNMIICSPHAVWMEFAFGLLFVFLKDGTRDVYK